MEEENNGSYELKSLIAGIVFLILPTIIVFFLNRTNASHRQREKELLMYGGSVEEANKYIEKRNKLVTEIKSLEKSEAERFGHLMIYTNDTAHSMKLVLQGDYSLEKEEPSVLQSDLPVWQHETTINKCKRESNIMSEFIRNKAYYGFNIFAINTLKGYEVPVVNSADSTDACYRLTYFFYYTEKEKKIRRAEINKNNNGNVSFFEESKEQQLEKLEGLQVRRINIKEKDLLQNKKNSIVAYLKFMGLDLSKVKGDLFYFSCYNKAIDKATFSKNIALLKRMFPKNTRKKLNGKIRTLKVFPL